MPLRSPETSLHEIINEIMKERFASSVFADFYNVSELYRSSTGAVYRASFKYDSKEYVLKERKLPELGRSKDIMNEVNLLLQLNHPNVVSCEGWFRDEQRKSVFIVLELCAGGDLHNIVEERRKSGMQFFQEKQVWFIFQQVNHCYIVGDITAIILHNVMIFFRFVTVFVIFMKTE